MEVNTIIEFRDITRKAIENANPLKIRTHREISSTDAAFECNVSDLLGKEERGDWHFRARKQHMLYRVRFNSPGDRSNVTVNSHTDILRTTRLVASDVVHIRISRLALQLV